MESHIIENQESTEGYHLNAMFNSNLEKENFTLKENDNFKQNLVSKIKNIVSRKNILKFGLMTGELAIPSQETKGTTMISIINSNQIRKSINSLHEKERSKIQYIHISTVQIILKSTFMKGVDTPINLELLDNRMIRKEDALIAKGKCNLKEGKVRFDVNLQIGISLKDKELDRAIVFCYELLKKNFMKEDHSPFSICYRVNYAISNSHHSIQFAGKELINIDELFSDYIQLETPVFRNPERNLFLPIEKKEENINLREINARLLSIENKL